MLTEADYSNLLKREIAFLLLFSTTAFVAAMRADKGEHITEKVACNTRDNRLQLDTSRPLFTVLGNLTEAGLFIIYYLATCWLLCRYHLQGHYTVLISLKNDDEQKQSYFKMNMRLML